MITEELQYQINSAVQTAFGRISTGTKPDQAYIWLSEELEQIYNGEKLYEDE